MLLLSRLSINKPEQVLTVKNNHKSSLRQAGLIRRGKMPAKINKLLDQCG